MRTIALAAVTIALAAAQSPSFEVAAVKPNNSGTHGSSIDGSGGRLTLTNVSLRECIAYAFGIPTGRDQELETPAWMSDANFDISAKPPADTPRDRVREMLRGLLAERFHLETHKERKKVPAYVLTVAKGGPKLKLDTETRDGSFTFGRGRIVARGIGMTGLANRLSGRQFDLDRLVIDETGLKGAYDFELYWAVEGAPPDALDASLFTSVKEQLGLELKGQEVEIDVLVVDRADRMPQEN
jgi:uncharacterized protein (TIGR03435 family)